LLRQTKKQGMNREAERHMEYFSFLKI